MNGDTRCPDCGYIIRWLWSMCEECLRRKREARERSRRYWAWRRLSDEHGGSA